MTDAEVDRVIEDARRANTELHIRDNNGKVTQNNYQTPKGGGAKHSIPSIKQPSENIIRVSSNNQSKCSIF